LKVKHDLRDAEMPERLYIYTLSTELIRAQVLYVFSRFQDKQVRRQLRLSFRDYVLPFDKLEPVTFIIVKSREVMTPIFLTADATKDSRILHLIGLNYLPSLGVQRLYARSGNIA
jgi:hypothetical protein